MKYKLSLSQAQEIAKSLKKKYKFGESTCPVWFGGTCTSMGQDGGYNVSVCIPAWSAITEDEKNVFLEPFEGANISLRVVVPAKPYVSKKNEEEEDVKKKKRRSTR